MNDDLDIEFESRYFEAERIIMAEHPRWELFDKRSQSRILHIYLELTPVENRQAAKEFLESYL